MEDNLKSLENGRRPNFFRKWNTIPFLEKMEDNLNFLECRRRPQFFRTWKTTLNFLENGSRPLILRVNGDPYVWNLEKQPQ
jgi:hypothetical protein